MRKIYHTEQEKREARRAYDHKRQQTEGRKAYDRHRRNNDEARAKRRERNAKKREETKRNPPLPTPDKVKQMSLFKVCPRCSAEKFLAEFPRDKNRPIGYSPICKECQRKYATSDKGRERERERSKQRRLDPAYCNVMNERKKAWNVKNPLAVREYTLKRSAKIREAHAEDIDFADILQRDGMWCYICEQSILPGQKTDFDHVIPLSRGGVHTKDNLKIVHRVCNRRKHNKLLSELTEFDRRGIE